MQTSYFANVKNLPDDVTPVAISQGLPRWFKGRRELRLAPTWEMLRKMTQARYDREFAKMLAALDPEEIFESLGDDAVLLCWERPFQRCHRRLVAEWIERTLKIEVPEFGFDRADVPAYEEMDP